PWRECCPGGRSRTARGGGPGRRSWTTSVTNPWRTERPMDPHTTPAPLDRDARQRGLVPPAALAACHALVVGVGAVGRQAALQLAAVGVPRLTLLDDDVVGPENLAAQGYWEEDVGRAKVDATAALCRIHPRARVTPRRERFRRSAAASLAAEGRLAV